MSEKSGKEKKHVYIPIELSNIIQERSEKNDRNFSGELVHLLKIALDKEKKEIARK